MRGSSTLCSAVARGSRLKVWNTNPISLLRIRASASSSRSETFWALSQYSPDVGVSRQPIRFMRVDLPDPDGPMTATYSFFLICTLTPCSARTTSPPMSYARVSLWVRMTMSGSGVSPVRNAWSPGAVLEIADRLVGSGDDRFAGLQACRHLEVLVSGDPDLHPLETRDPVLHDEYALRLLLLPRGGSVSRPRVGRRRLVLAHRERD